MSTIVTRKSLALGAIVALATTVFAGAPAHAANEIILAPSAGTSLSTLSTDAFALESTFAPGVTNANSQLWFQIKTSTNVSVDVAADTTAADAVAGLGAAVVATAGTAAEGAEGSYVYYVRAAGYTSSTARNFVAVALHGATSVDAGDVTVTAFVDSSNDGKLTTSPVAEWSTAKTVSFKKYSAVTPTLTLTQPNVADTDLAGSISFPGLNADQLRGTVKLAFKHKSGDTLDGTDGVAAAGGITATATSGVYKATVDSITALNNVADVQMSALYRDEAIGTAVHALATDRTISNIQATVDATDNSYADTNSNDGFARTNTAFTVTAKALSNATSPVAAAGVTLKVTIDDADATWVTTAGSESALTVNGVKYTTSAKLAAATIEVKTDANGKAVVTVVPENFAAGDAFLVGFAAQHYSADSYVELADAVYTVSDDAAVSVRKVVKNGSVVINYSVKDQFGVLSAKTNQRLHVTSGNVSAKPDQYIAVVGGKAAVTVTASKDTTDTITVNARLQAKTVNSDESVQWDNVSGSGSSASAITVNVSDVADDFDAVPAQTRANASGTSADAQDLETLAWTSEDLVLAGATFAKIEGSVKVAGSVFTVSGSGLAFVINDKLYQDTVTVPTATTAFTVYVASHKAGVQTVTFKTGAVTKTVDVTFAGATLASVKNTAVAAPSQAQAGRSVNITATITDAYGNVVAGKLVKFAVDGVGTLSSSDAVTDSKGVATVRLTSAYGEDGDATVTVSHNGADTATTDAGKKDDFTLVKTVAFGITDATIDNVGKRATVVASYSKGKTVGIYVNGVKRWSKISSTDADVVVSWNLKKGRNTVTVKLSGGLVTSEVIVVK